MPVASPVVNEQRDEPGRHPEEHPGAHGADGAHGTMALQCMEVWGGNGVSEQGVNMAGVDAWVLSRPHEGDTSGGDVHYVSTCGTGRITRMMVADVAGHGDKVSDLALLLRNLMRRYVNHIDQGRFVAGMNREFSARARAGRFATAVVATYYAPTSYFVATNAGHPRPLIYSARTKSWGVMVGERHDMARETPRSGIAPQDLPTQQPSGPKNVPLGVLDDTAYEQFAVKLRPGDLVVLYTDSLVEARLASGDQGGTMLGERGLLEIARDLDVSKPTELARRLMDAVVQRCEGRPPDDDVTIMVIRPNGLLPRVPIVQRVRAQLMFVWLLLGSWRRQAPPVPWPEARVENLLGPVSRAANTRWGRGAREL
jgi:sigma-B regulation protein RsbU (phosphoserine phosphatase)